MHGRVEACWAGADDAPARARQIDPRRRVRAELGGALVRCSGVMATLLLVPGGFGSRGAFVSALYDAEEEEDDDDDEDERDAAAAVVADSGAEAIAAEAEDEDEDEEKDKHGRLRSVMCWCLVQQPGGLDAGFCCGEKGKCGDSALRAE
jgi:hypothetical protein